MAEERTRPQYGEYATPEDQARAAGETDAARAPSSPDEWSARQQAPVRTPIEAAPPATPAVAARRPRRWDVLTSFLLLTYGLLTVVSGAGREADLGGVIRDVFDRLGIGAFTSDARAEAFGLAITVVNVVLYVIVFAVTLALLRARRIAFYVPLVGGILSVIVMVTLLLVVMIGDPAFQEYAGSTPGP
jgi:hypothetical protein